MRRVFILVIALAGFYPGAIDACELNVSFFNKPEDGAVLLEWDVPPFSSQYPILYDIFERRASGYAASFRYAGSALTEVGASRGSRTLVVNASEQMLFEYLVVSRLQDNDSVGCAGRVQGEVTPNSLRVSLGHRKIVPIVGSVRGAHGSDFRTSVTLHHFPYTKGKIYFRPAGTQPSATDPYVAYEFKDNDVPPFVIHFDDIVATMGAQGMGSLEIVPDPKTRLAVPPVEVRAYNVTGQGTFGTRVPAVWIPSWYPSPEAPEPTRLLVPPVEPNFRRNVGFRTLTPINYLVRSRTADGQYKNLGTGQAPANYTWFGSVSDLAGVPVPHDTNITVEFFGGIVIGFRTETENGTNDPTVVLSDPSELERELFWH